MPPPPLDAALVLHAAAWTDVDGAESDPQGAAAVNVGGTQHVAELGVPFVYYSTDYVFDGSKTEPYVESDAPSPQSVYGRTKLQGEAVALAAEAWIVRSSWLVGWTSRNFVRTMLALGRERGAELPARAGYDDASRAERIGDGVLHRWRTRSSSHGTSCSSGRSRSYSSVTR